MGTTIGSLHILVKTDVSHDSVAEAVKEIIERQGYHEVDEIDEAQKAGFIASKKDCPWVSVYGIELSGNYPFTSYDDLERTGAALSASLNKPVVNIEVFDSDVINLKIFLAGNRVDTFSNWSNYDSSPPKKSGQAEKWEMVFPEGVISARLKNTWKSKRTDYPFEAEGILARVADLLRMDRELVHMDGRDFSDIEEDTDNDNDDAGLWVTMMYFKKA